GARAGAGAGAGRVGGRVGLGVGWRAGRKSGRVLFRHRTPAGSRAGVAQLVARHLAKVKVAGSSPVARSERPPRLPRPRPRWGGREARQRPAKPCTRVQIPSPPPRAVGAAGARFLDAEEVTGSIPVPPTSSEATSHRWTWPLFVAECLFE